MLLLSCSSSQSIQDATTIPHVTQNKVGLQPSLYCPKDDKQCATLTPSFNVENEYGTLTPPDPADDGYMNPIKYN